MWQGEQQARLSELSKDWGEYKVRQATFDAVLSTTAPAATCASTRLPAAWSEGTAPENWYHQRDTM